jgi:hypothetical protein
MLWRATYVHECFIDHQKAARAPRIRQIEQFMFLEHAAVRVVGIGHNGKISAAELFDACNLGYLMPCQRGGAGEFPIGGPKHSRLSGPHKRRYGGEQDLRPGGRNHAIPRRRSIGLGRDCGQAVEGGGLRQPRK